MTDQPPLGQQTSASTMAVLLMVATSLSQLLPTSLLPANLHQMPNLSSFTQTLASSYAWQGLNVFDNPDVNRLLALTAFAEKFLKDSRTLDPKLAEILNDTFWDIYEPF